ncbi:MAG: Y-family DNA polymerase [Cocleimonas sp.]
MYAIADCNNFYASCQRVFRPDLSQTPIVVLSNNDGCIIARSNEAKALGIPMGAPYFKWKGFFKQHSVQVFSSNYALYGDMSARVMNVLESFEADIEVYSIDEAFLRISQIPANKLRSHALQIKRTTQQWTGIPISIGLAPTKTLAKLAGKAGKKQADLAGVLVLNSFQEAMPYLKQTPIGDVWGVGRRWSEQLQHNGIRTAADLALSNHSWIRKRYSVVLQRTAMELAGESCIALEETPARKQILVSRSFRPKVTDYNTLHSFLAGYISRAAEKLRDQGSVTKNITMFVSSGSHADHSHSNSLSINLSQYTADTATLIRAGGWGLQRLYQSGYTYYKAGLMLNDLIPEANQQYPMFAPAVYDDAARNRMQLMDSINQRFGPATLRSGREPKRRWQMYQQHLSPAYTTRWDELLRVS